MARNDCPIFAHLNETEEVKKQQQCFIVYRNDCPIFAHVNETEEVKTNNNDLNGKQTIVLYSHV